LPDYPPHVTESLWFQLWVRSFQADDALTIAAAHALRALEMGWANGPDRLRPIERDAQSAVLTAAAIISMLELFGRFLPTNVAGGNMRTDLVSPHAAPMDVRRRTRTLRMLDRSLSPRDRKRRRQRLRLERIAQRGTRDATRAIALLDQLREQHPGQNNNDQPVGSDELGTEVKRMWQSPCIDALNATIVAVELLNGCATFGNGSDYMDPFFEANAHSISQTALESLVVCRHDLVTQAVILLALP
jgi:hypothetical protein